MQLDFGGPPVPQQFIGFAILLFANWIIGFIFQYLGKDLFLVRNKQLPLWMRWLCGMFNPRHAIDKSLAYLQLLSFLGFILAVAGFILAPNAGVFVVYCIILVIVYGVFIPRILRSKSHEPM